MGRVFFFSMSWNQNCGCGRGTYGTPPGGVNYPINPAPYNGMPLCQPDLVVWERMISATPELDVGDSLHFFVAKYPIMLDRISAEVKGEEVSIELWIDGVHKVNMSVNIASGPALFYASKKLTNISVDAGDVVSIKISDAGGSGSDAADLSIELRGREVVS